MPVSDVQNTTSPVRGLISHRVLVVGLVCQRSGDLLQVKVAQVKRPITINLCAWWDPKPPDQATYVCSLRRFRRGVGVGPQIDRGAWHTEPMLDHLSIQCSDLVASAAFYDTVLAPLGVRRVMEFSAAIGYGVNRPQFWIGQQSTGEGFRESHIAFAAADRACVDAFCAAAVAAGAQVLHEPRVWPEYHPSYYGAFVRDPDGNNVEAVCHQLD